MNQTNGGYAAQGLMGYPRDSVGGAAALAQQDCSTKQPEVQRYADDVDQLLQSCMVSLDQLEARVSPVCRGEPPTAQEKANQIEPAPQTQVSQRLDGMCRNLRQIRDRIDAISRRLEV